ncbi:MAG: type 4a pilus biogenesis protein PilO [Thermodesulfovibrionales bacterium]|nr:type 4a pilus biogenesis protein PilO [Thermodesulfovibrionales bacterium]
MKLGFDMGNLSAFKKALLLILPPFMIVVVSYTIFLSPLLSEVSRLSEETKRQNEEIVLAKEQAMRLTAMIAENERLKNKLLALQQQLPEEREVSGLLKQVSELGVKSGLTVILWKPKEKIVHPSKEVYEIPVEVEMKGFYHRFGQFFSEITRLNRIVNISDINMKTEKQKDAAAQKTQKIEAGLDVNFTAMTYSLIPEKEKKELEKAEKEKEKEKKK